MSVYTAGKTIFILDAGLPGSIHGWVATWWTTRLMGWLLPTAIDYRVAGKERPDAYSE
jgi:hypothetical protein